jgi:hypothetical protein
LKSHRDEYTKLSFPVAHLVVKSQELALADLGC